MKTVSIKAVSVIICADVVINFNSAIQSVNWF